jgi:hypothetical protein
MGDILIVTVLSFAAWHRYESSGLSLDDLETPYHEAVVEGNAGERFEFRIIPHRDSHLGDVHEVPPLLEAPISTGFRRI